MSNILNYYLRNDDNEKIAGLGSVAGNLTDIGFNIPFVLILGYGTSGSSPVHHDWPGSCHPVLSARYPGRKAYTKIPACPSCAGGRSRGL